MKKRLKLKPFVVPMIYLVFVIALLATVFVSRKQYKEQEDNTIYVTSSILDSYVPVVNLDAQIVRPYLDNTITIGINYYSSTDPEDEQAKSIVYYAGTYMPNSGIDYVSSNVFDVVSILDGEVIEVKEEELLGKSVTIRHDNDLISVYQGLSEVSVEKNEQVSIGQTIGKSGTSELNKDLGNHLHFELMYKGQTVDPENYYDKKISELN